MKAKFIDFYSVALRIFQQENFLIKCHAFYCWHHVLPVDTLFTVRYSIYEALKPVVLNALFGI